MHAGKAVFTFMKPLRLVINYGYIVRRTNPNTYATAIAVIKCPEIPVLFLWFEVL